VNSFLVGFIIASLIFLISLTSQAFAQVSPEVVINEFAIEPEQTAELLNTSNEIIDISGWYIDDNGGTTYIVIPINTFLYPHSCVVIQKNFNLNKSSADMIRLFNSTFPPTDPLSELVDFYEYRTSPGNEISFQRNPDGTDVWDVARSSFGLLNESGKSCQMLPTETPTPKEMPTNTPTHSPTIYPAATTAQSISPTPKLYDNIYISEVMVAPESGKKEWVELYNDNDFEVNLSGWYIDDIENAGASPKIISIIIDAHGYGVIEMLSALFNNSGDSVRLLDFEEREHDRFSYDHSEKDTSWGWSKFKSDTFCLQLPSQNEKNSECIPDQVSSPATLNSAEDYQNSVYSTTSPTLIQTNQQSLQSTLYKTYSVPVSPPIITLQWEKVDQQVQAISSTNNFPQQNTFDFSYLAMGYSLLSIGSLVLKMIYSN